MYRTCLHLLLAATLLLCAAALPGPQSIFLHITDASGKAIRGTSVARGYENQVTVTSFGGITAGNPVVQFTMPSGTATASLATMQGGKQKIQRALFTVAQQNERLEVASTVLLEDISVEQVHDAGGFTNVSLRASRIGTTYYQYDRKRGTRTISGKTGFDFLRGAEWNNF